MDPLIGCFRLDHAAKRTCSQCRHRKVRCDGRSSGCQHCHRLHFHCSLLPSSIREVGKPQRCRAPKACQACRNQKIRCSGTSPQCSNCQSRGEMCTYSAHPSRRVRSNRTCESREKRRSETTYTPTSDGTERLGPIIIDYIHADADVAPSLTPKDSLHSVKIYFSELYPLPSYSFLHPETTIALCKSGKLEPLLELALHGVVCLHNNANSTGYNDRGARWIHTTEQALWQELDILSIPRLQALLLVIRYHMEAGLFQKAFTLIAVAARFAAAMRLNHEQTGSNAIAREECRRMLWSLKLIERYFSIGLPEFEVLPFESIYIQFPCPEDEFSDAERAISSSVGMYGDHGAFGLCMRLESIRRDIMKASRGLALCEDGFPQVHKLILGFRSELEDVGSQMATGREMTGPPAWNTLPNRWLCRYAMLHLSWHQSHCDLYRLLLPGYQEAAPDNVLATIAQAQKDAAKRQCLEHALSIVRLVASLNEGSRGPLQLEFDTAICVYHAVRLIIFIARDSEGTDSPSPEFANSRAILCLAALRRFFESSILVQPIINEVQRLIDMFPSPDGANSTLASSSGSDDRRDPARKISPVAKTQQRLAIHSLLSRVELAHENDAARHIQPFARDTHRTRTPIEGSWQSERPTATCEES